MKHISPFLITLFALCLGVANAWADTATLSISKSVTSSGSLSDDKNNVWTLSSDGTYTGNTSYIQAGTNKSQVSYIKLQCSAFASVKITKIQVWGTSKANTNVSAKVYIGDNLLGTSSTYASQTASSGGTEFAVDNTQNYSGDVLIEISRSTSATGAIYFNKAIITYETSTSSCTKPIFTIEDKTITLAEATNLFDMSTITTDKGGSTGAITYTCSDKTNVDTEGSTFYTETPGTYTITATMAADDIYCEATTTFKITVQAAPCTPLTTPTGLSESVTAYNSATLSWAAVENATKYQITTTPPRVRK